ncbi:MAG TPA: glycosyltransferase family 2 protein [bacterium]|nr:glycosyltransferase family 2 protein [bacterium]
MRKCSILIPTYNGKEILRACLPSVIEAVAGRGNIDEILVLDNAGTDGTADYLKSNYPDVNILRLNENKAIFALNDGARAAAHDYLFFLNDDMIVTSKCIDSLLMHFDEPDAFAVTGKVYQWDGKTVQAARRRPAYHRGYFWYLPAKNPDDAGITLHALGGQSVFSKEKYLELGGIDPLFSPFYHEDLDISWRALRRGWKVIFEPRAEMIHKGAATAGKMYSQQDIRTIMQKNMFLFMWKNIHDDGMIKEYRKWIIPRILRAAFNGDAVFLNGFRLALGQAAQARTAAGLIKDTKLTDSDVFNLFK